MPMRDFFAAVGVVVCGDAVSVAAVLIAARLAGKNISVTFVDKRRFHTIHKPYDQDKEGGSDE